MKRFFLFFGLLFSCLCSQAQYKLTVQISDFKPAKGNIVVYVFSASKTDTNQKPERKIVKAATKNPQSIVFEGLKSGEYGVFVHQDLNSNEKMDKSFIGMPKEPIGLSNNVKIGLKMKPQDMVFVLNKDQTISIKLVEL